MNLFLNLILMVTLIIISCIDFKKKVIPGKFISFVFILGAVKNLINIDRILDGLTGLIVGGGILLIIAVITKGGLGGGDVKLVAVLGLFLGLKKVLLLITLSILTGALASVVLILLKAHKYSSTISFGPFIAISTFLVIVYGNEIIHWYVETVCI